MDEGGAAARQRPALLRPDAAGGGPLRHRGLLRQGLHAGYTAQLQVR